MINLRNVFGKSIVVKKLLFFIVEKRRKSLLFEMKIGDYQLV